MAVINALGPLVKTRHTISTKIINELLKVDLASIQSTTDPTKAQLQLRSVSKTIRIHLYHFLKSLSLPGSADNIRNNAAGSLAKNIEQYLRTSQVNGLIYDGEDLSRKRGAEDDVGSQPPLKRVRADGQMGVPPPVDPAVALAFLLDPTNPLALYDANTLPAALVTEIVIRTLEFLPPQLLEDRLNVPCSPNTILMCVVGTCATFSRPGCPCCDRGHQWRL
jgi:Symplekin/PTA1 N-terminal